jgi:hypothetical protein
MKIILAVLLLSASLPGCPDHKPQQQDKPAATPSRVPYQRFMPIAPLPYESALWHGAFALDTKTGQLCKTISWQITGTTDLVQSLNQIKTCLELYTKYPDQGTEIRSQPTVITSREKPPPGTKKINSSGDEVVWDGEQWKLMEPEK